MRRDAMPLRRKPHPDNPWSTFGPPDPNKPLKRTRLKRTSLKPMSAKPKARRDALSPYRVWWNGADEEETSGGINIVVP
jgi:hypothetical protein